MSIRDNLLYINDKIENAKIKSGRKDDVKLIAVTKTIDIDRIKEAIELGVTDIGENKVQELELKIPVLGNSINYHMIGYLQTNKVKYIVDKVNLIHSLDRISLAKEIDKRAKSNDIIVDTLIQINVAEEETKSGLKVEEVLSFTEEVLRLENIRIKGLMTIAPFTEDKKLLRNIFRTMAQIKEDIKSRNYQNLSMDFLSMGMTNDYEIAIEEGANLIRVGTGIFGKRNY
ncbi:YggS family pyridoxal phosphate-dependent enzyme [Tissierella sp. Yu-01]|uniref:YggS family pyridoxal phosphate-dependent enzyme n=1 Tax=Tissierella sp. Yu-01 TaxID=3035694 RepID=UPI00240E2180|nr:YggS family pyridoxal phosphate-dependent enzyme [Tissierella sp. Yu-01]WFA10431.1 YggS family pyridoxal phosphate-dependent enzyme [Tissierella sp. Yu-01]